MQVSLFSLVDSSESPGCQPAVSLPTVTQPMLVMMHNFDLITFQMDKLSTRTPPSSIIVTKVKISLRNTSLCKGDILIFYSTVGHFNMRISMMQCQLIKDEC